MDEHVVRDPLRVYTRDELLTTVSLYWFTRTIGSSMRLYYETFGPGATISQSRRIDVPTGFSLFNDPNAPPRQLDEPTYDIRYFNRVDGGRHFPALADLAAPVRVA